MKTFFIESINHWQSYVKKVFSKFHGKYQKILQNSNKSIIQEKAHFQQIREKSNKPNIKHPFSQYCCT